MARKLALSFISSFLIIVFFACSAPRLENGNLVGINGILDAVYRYLSQEQCDSAIELVTPVYSSGFTGNEVRMAFASAHGCATGINFFVLLNELSSSNLVGSGFWTTMTRLFPSTIGSDSKFESAELAWDALLATLKPGKVVTSANEVNASTPNPGSINATDRTDDANAYLMFVSMAVIGSIQNRYGAPDTSFQKTVNLPWDDRANVDTDGCAYASSIITLIDSYNAISPVISGSTAAQALDPFIGSVEAGIDNACSDGCAGTGTTCTTACAACPTSLLNRASCDNTSDTDEAACATAGIVDFVNLGAPLGWPT